MTPVSGIASYRDREMPKFSVLLSHNSRVVLPVHLVRTPKVYRVFPALFGTWAGTVSPFAFSTQVMILVKAKISIIR